MLYSKYAYDLNVYPQILRSIRNYVFTQNKNFTVNFNVIASLIYYSTFKNLTNQHFWEKKTPSNNV